jgi:hypothetical protein
MTIKNYLIVMTLLLVVGAASGQDRREARERIESRKIAYLSDKLELTSTEAQVFWPLYNEYRQELKGLRNEKEKGDRDEMTDAEALEHLDRMLDIQQSGLDIKKKYQDKMVSTIGAKKTMLLWRHDRKFKEEIIREVRKKRGS